MARGSKSSENAVSLFPFLAVLVCVMGSLIFLLLATTKRMHEIARAEAEILRYEEAATDLDGLEADTARAPRQGWWPRSAAGRRPKGR